MDAAVDEFLAEVVFDPFGALDGVVDEAIDFFEQRHFHQAVDGQDLAVVVGDGLGGPVIFQVEFGFVIATVHTSNWMNACMLTVVPNVTLMRTYICGVTANSRPNGQSWMY